MCLAVPLLPGANDKEALEVWKPCEWNEWNK